MWQPCCIFDYHTHKKCSAYRDMSIRFIEETKHLILETKNTGYHMKIDRLGYLQHMYYGPKPGQDDLSYAFRFYDGPSSGNP